MSDLLFTATGVRSQRVGQYCRCCGEESRFFCGVCDLPCASVSGCACRCAEGPTDPYEGAHTSKRSEDR